MQKWPSPFLHIFKYIFTAEACNLLNVHSTSTANCTRSVFVPLCRWRLNKDTAGFSGTKSFDWLIEQCFTSPPTQYTSYGRRFYRSKDPTNSIKVLKERTKCFPYFCNQCSNITKITYIYFAHHCHPIAQSTSSKCTLLLWQLAAIVHLYRVLHSVCPSHAYELLKIGMP